MIDLIYIEREALDHPRTRGICAAFPEATQVECERYTEVFNPRHQNFRLQKQRPALILAIKKRGLVLPTPEGYGFGGGAYYFSHMLNCVYDCRYCFLQGMYRSAHYVLFVNYEDFGSAIRNAAGADQGMTWFFSGYDCDSLALDPVTDFVTFALGLFEGLTDASLELRTKSTQIRSLLASEPLSNVVIAFSFTPGAVSRALEHKVPALEKRLAAARRLAECGWPIGFRFDPVIYHKSFRSRYEELFELLFGSVNPRHVHSVTLGPFRMPKSFHKRLSALYPEEPLFAAARSEKGGVVSYPRDIERDMLEYCERKLATYIDPARIFPNGYEYSQSRSLADQRPLCAGC